MKERHPPLRRVSAGPISPFDLTLTSIKTEWEKRTRPARAAAKTDTFAWLARAGFASRGLNYAIIGVLAARLALTGGSGDAANQEGALAAIAHQPLGKVLLAIVAVGLAGYSSWRLVRAGGVVGPEGGKDTGIDRLAAAGSGCFYGALSVVAFSILLGKSHASGGSQPQGAGVFGWPGGRELIGAAAVVVFAMASFQVYRGVTTNFLDDAKQGEMSAVVKRWVEAIGVVGHVARGIVFGLVGAFLLKSAIEYDPNAAVGLDGALRRLQQAPYGSALLGIVACGLIVFALYSWSDARYRRL